MWRWNQNHSKGKIHLCDLCKWSTCAIASNGALEKVMLIFSLMSAGGGATFLEKKPDSVFIVQLILSWGKITYSEGHQTFLDVQMILLLWHNALYFGGFFLGPSQVTSAMAVMTELNIASLCSTKTWHNWVGQPAKNQIFVDGESKVTVQAPGKKWSCRGALAVLRKKCTKNAHLFPKKIQKMYKKYKKMKGKSREMT